MTDMIERVARALKRVINERCGLPDDEPWELYKDEAIAAIKATRDVIAENGGDTTMIDAALGDKK